MTSNRQWELRRYQTVSGKIPFDEWFKRLKDPKTQARVLARLARVEQGNFGDYKVIGDGIQELRLQYGSGYRIYFAQEGQTILLLLCGGDKSSQSQDIRQAQDYWHEYQNSQRSGQP